MAEGGDKTIAIPEDCSQVKELYTGRVVSVKDRHFTYKFASPDTALFEMVK